METKPLRLMLAYGGRTLPHTLDCDLLLTVHVSLDTPTPGLSEVRMRGIDGRREHPDRPGEPKPLSPSLAFLAWLSAGELMLQAEHEGAGALDATERSLLEAIAELARDLRRAKEVAAHVDQARENLAAKPAAIPGVPKWIRMTEDGTLGIELVDLLADITLIDVARQTSGTSPSVVEWRSYLTDFARRCANAIAEVQAKLGRPLQPIVDDARLVEKAMRHVVCEELRAKRIPAERIDN